MAQGDQCLITVSVAKAQGNCAFVWNGILFVFVNYTSGINVRLAWDDHRGVFCQPGSQRWPAGPLTFRVPANPIAGKAGMRSDSRGGKGGSGACCFLGGKWSPNTAYYCGKRIRLFVGNIPIGGPLSWLRGIDWVDYLLF